MEFAGGIFVAASVTAEPAAERPVRLRQQRERRSRKRRRYGLYPRPDGRESEHGRVRRRHAVLRSARPITGIHVRGKAGNDVFQADSDVTLPLWLYGGNGNNTLTGGAGNNVIVGGSGQNVIHSSNGVSTPETVDDSERAATGLADYFQDTGIPAWTSQAVAGAFNGEELSHAASTGTDNGGVDVCQSRSERVIMTYMSPGRRSPGPRRAAIHRSTTT